MQLLLIQLGDASPQIRQLQRVAQTGEWRAYVLGLDAIGDVSLPYPTLAGRVT